MFRIPPGLHSDTKIIIPRFFTRNKEYVNFIKLYCDEKISDVYSTDQKYLIGINSDYNHLTLKIKYIIKFIINSEIEIDNYYSSNYLSTTEIRRIPYKKYIEIDYLYNIILDSEIPARGNNVNIINHNIHGILLTDNNYFNPLGLLKENNNYFHSTKFVEDISRLTNNNNRIEININNFKYDNNGYICGMH